MDECNKAFAFNMSSAYLDVSTFGSYFNFDFGEFELITVVWQEAAVNRSGDTLSWSTFHMDVESSTGSCMV